MQRSASSFFTVPNPRKDVLKYLELDLQRQVYTKQIMLSFIGDVYCNNGDDSATTRSALQLLNHYNAPVAVLSKGGRRMLRDLDVFKAFGDRIMVGTTLTFVDDAKSRQWEPGAALPEERLETLSVLRSEGIRTFASFEPVLEPEESLRCIERTLHDDSVIHYKIGKLNNFKGLDREHDWQGYLKNVLALLRPANKQIYVKKSLRDLAPEIELYEDEVDPERYITRC
jgi:DNA repair photolyase